MDKAEHDARRLRDRGRRRRRPDAPVEHRDEEQVEPDVEQRGENEVVERPPAVAQGVHDALADVVHHDRKRAVEVIAEILDCVRQNGGVGAHPDEEGRRIGNAHDGEEDAREKTERDVRVDGARDALPVARAEIAGDRDARAHRGADEKAHEQKNQVARRADCGQCFGAEIAAHNEGVRCVVELLKDLTQKDRDRKIRNESPGAAARHVLCGARCHGSPLIPRKCAQENAPPGGGDAIHYIIS